MRSLFFVALLIAGGLSASALANPSSMAPEPRAWLGVGFNGNSRALVINEVIRDTPADIAGLQVNDVILGIDGNAIRKGEDLIKVIESHRVGDRVEVSLRRAGQALRVSTELAGKLDPSELIQRRLVDNPAIPFSLPTLHGKEPGHLKKLRDKVVVLEFWSTTCSGCAKTLGPLASFSAEHAGDVAVLLITPESAQTVTSYLKNYASPLTVLHDAYGRTKVLYRSPMDGPTVVVVGRDGIVRHADTGSNIDMDDLLLEAKRAVREQPAI